MAFHIANSLALVHLGKYPVWVWLVQVMVCNI